MGVFVNYVLVAMLACLAGTVLLCSSALPVASWLKLIDDPRAKLHGFHDTPTPLLGGLAIIVPWLLAGVATLLGTDGEPPVIPILTWQGLGFIAFFLTLGAIDDRRGLSVKGRLIAKTLAYAVLVTSTTSLSISKVALPGLGLAWDISFIAAPFTILCMVALNNAINMCDGRNCLVIGMSFVWLVSLLLYVPALRVPLVLILPAMLAVTGWFNWRGRLFLGDAGAYALSTLVGILAVWAHQLPPALGGLTSPQLATLFAIPALDMLRIIGSRLRRGASITAPDSDHMHHRLDRTFGWSIGLPAYLLAIALPIAVSLSSHHSGLAGLCLALLSYSVLWHVTKAQAAGSSGTLATQA